jgi:tetratricopeptide (TPR) repeat protein
MKRAGIILAAILLFGALRVPLEHAFLETHRRFLFRTVDFNLGLREQVSQVGFVAALSGFRSLVADVLFIQAHVAWERTQWSRVLLLFRQATTLQPRNVLFWDMAAWHMAWNASTAALNDPLQPREALRIKAAREYLQLGKDFLERGIKNNPDRPELYEALARLYRDKYQDHEHASEFFAKAADIPGAHSYARRFAAYELAQCPGREREAYEQLRALYNRGEQERLPALVRHLKELEIKLNIAPVQRIPD